MIKNKETIIRNAVTRKSCLTCLNNINGRCAYIDKPIFQCDQVIVCNHQTMYTELKEVY